MNLVEQALTEHWGEKCDSYEQGCPVCDAWREYENLVTYGASAATALVKHELTHARVRRNLMIDDMLRTQIDPEIRDAITKIILDNNVGNP